MRAALLCVLLVVGCSKKSENSEPAPKGAPPAEQKAPADKPPEPAPAEARPAEAPKPPPGEPAPPAADAPKVDCNALLTADDLKKACNDPKFSIKAIKDEGTKSPDIYGVCSRQLFRDRGLPVGNWSLMVKKDVAAAQGWVKLEKTKTAKELPGIADEAWLNEPKDTKNQYDDYFVGVRKGTMILRVSVNNEKKLPCTPEQLVEVAKVAAARLP